MQHVVNTQVVNVGLSQPQTVMFAKGIEHEVEMLRKAVLQSFTQSANAETTVTGVSKRNYKQVQIAVLAKDIE
jgi:hypothetical protein